MNITSIDKLINDSQYCQQPLIEIASEFEGKYSIRHTLLIMQRQGKLISVLRQFLGRSIFEKDGITTFDDIRPLIDKEAFEIAERRKQMLKYNSRQHSVWIQAYFSGYKLAVKGEIDT